MAISITHKTEFWQELELYTIVSYIDVHTWFIEVKWFYDKEACDDWARPILVKKFAYSTKKTRMQEIQEEIEVEGKKIMKPTGKYKAVDNEDYIAKWWDMLKKAYNYIKKKDQFENSKDV